MKKLRMTVGNKSYDVTVEDLTAADAFPGPSPPPQPSASAPAAPVQAAPTAQAARPQLPVDAGAVHDTVAWRSPAVARTFLGAPGTVTILMTVSADPVLVLPGTVTWSVTVTSGPPVSPPAP